jgi:hypothetical protein
MSTKDQLTTNTTQQFNISAQGNATPTGNGAQMSITNANNQPSQGQWHTANVVATVKLPSAVWDVTPNDGSAFAFTIQPNSSSATYGLKSNAPLGSQMYSIETPPGLGGGNSSPTVIVNP